MFRGGSAPTRHLCEKDGLAPIGGSFPKRSIQVDPIWGVRLRTRFDPIGFWSRARSDIVWCVIQSELVYVGQCTSESKLLIKRAVYTYVHIYIYILRLLGAENEMHVIA